MATIAPNVTAIDPTPGSSGWMKTLQLPASDSFDDGIQLNSLAGIGNGKNRSSGVTFSIDPDGRVKRFRRADVCPSSQQSLDVDGELEFVPLSSLNESSSGDERVTGLLSTCHNLFRVITLASAGPL